MDISFEKIYLKKTFPLRISRGIKYGADGLFVSLSKDGITGLGEMSPGVLTGAETADEGIEILSEYFRSGNGTMSIFEWYQLGRKMDIAPCAQAAFDIAMWDWAAKKAQMPLYQYLGFPKPKIATSMTLGILPSKEIEERLEALLGGKGFKYLKVKLGNPAGIDADKEMFAQVIEHVSKYEVGLRVDANGGWSVEDAMHMMHWLANRGVEYVEQPLVEGNEDGLPHIFKDRPLPIFVDESCRFAQQIPDWADSVDGVNLKLMKCGGITGALQIIHTAQAYGLKTMIGCMGESSVAIAAGAAVSGVLDHIDLDAHLNLAPDPADGAPLVNGVIVPTENAGHGAGLIL